MRPKKYTYIKKTRQNQDKNKKNLERPLRPGKPRQNICKKKIYIHKCVCIYSPTNHISFFKSLCSVFNQLEVTTYDNFEKSNLF